MSEKGYTRTVTLLKSMAANISEVTAVAGGGAMVIMLFRGHEVDVFDDASEFDYVSAVRFADGSRLSFEDTIKGDADYPTDGLSEDEFSILERKMLESYR
jgi:hypothetical protein